MNMRTLFVSCNFLLCAASSDWCWRHYCSRELHELSLAVLCASGSEFEIEFEFEWEFELSGDEILLTPLITC